MIIATKLYLSTLNLRNILKRLNGVLLKINLQKINKEKTIELISDKQALLDTKSKLQNILAADKQKLDKIVDNRYMLFKIIVLLLTMIITICLLYFVSKSDWEVTEKVFLLITIMSPLLGFLCFFVLEKPLLKNDILQRFLKECKTKITKKIYKKNDFDETELVNLNAEIKRIENEIEQLKMDV